MRLQLAAGAIARAIVAASAASAAVITLAGPAHADGEVTLRGAYYKERATRVVQPMVDATLDAGEDGTVDAHFLVDAITSASVASGADDEPFSELRYELGFGYLRKFGRLGIGAASRYSIEPDYQSAFGAVRFELALADDNFVLGLGLGLGADDISNEGAQAPPGSMGAEPLREESLITALGSLSASQILSRNLVASLTYDLSYLDGFQANIYRKAIAQGFYVPERHPETRLRHALASSVRWYVPRAVTTIIATYRFYVDDWGVNAHTPEARFVLEAGDTVELGVGYRLHLQGKADFWKATYASSDPAVEPFLTDDVKLSKFTSHTLAFLVAARGESLGFTGMIGDARGELVLEYTDQNNRFNNAIIVHAALTVPFEY